MLWIFLLIHVASAVRSDWACMHNAGVEELNEIVAEYSESFPCEECREHFNELLEIHPFQLEDVKTDYDAKAVSYTHLTLPTKA